VIQGAAVVLQMLSRLRTEAIPNFKVLKLTRIEGE
jgi:hypothetical protein